MLGLNLKWCRPTSKKRAQSYDFSQDIQLHEVTYTYSPRTPFEFKALHRSSTIFPKGQVTGIIGATGSGKSTLIQLINGLLIPSSGRVQIGDYRLSSATKRVPAVKQLRKEINLVFQFPEYQLFNETVEKDIGFGPIHLGESKLKVLKAVPKYMAMVGLPKSLRDRSPFELSGGQKRRVAIAGILAMEGNTLVLDEPTGGLDPQGEAEFLKLFARLNQEEDKRIIMISHNMDHILEIADKVVVMDRGKIVKEGTPFEIFGNESLLKRLDIEPPKIYQLLYEMRKRGLDLTKAPIRGVKDFAKIYAQQEED